MANLARFLHGGGGGIKSLILNLLLVAFLAICYVPVVVAQDYYNSIEIQWDSGELIEMQSKIFSAFGQVAVGKTAHVEIAGTDGATLDFIPTYESNGSGFNSGDRDLGSDGSGFNSGDRSPGADVILRYRSDSSSGSSYHDGGVNGAIIKVTSGISLNRAARIRMISLQRGGSLMLGQNEKQSGTILGQDPCDPCNPCGLLCGDNAAGKRSAWVNYIGRQDSASNGFGEWTSDSNGVQFGSDLYRTNRNQFGLQASYENAKFKSGATKLLDDEYVFGAYAAHVFRSGSDFRVLANVGWQDFAAKSVGINNLGKFKGNTYDITLEFGKRFFPVKNAGIRPVIALDIHDVHTDAYRTIDGNSYNKVGFTQTYFRVGTDYITLIKRLSLKSEIYYNYDLSRDSFKVTWQRGGNPLQTDKLFLGRQFVELGLTAQYDFRNNVALFGSFFLDGYFDRPSRPYQSVGTAGLSWVW
jgi:hypothetical protein